jgi:hypothetical protein
MRSDTSGALRRCRFRAECSNASRGPADAAASRRTLWWWLSTSSPASRRDYQAARSWYERLLGSEPAFFPHATEAVWELAEHRYLYIVEDQDAPGGAIVTILVDDLDALDAEIASRGIEPAERETYTNGVRKTIYRDADGNEIGFGGGRRGGVRA